MGIGNILALSQVTGYVLSIILFFFVCWPMGASLRDFAGNCILYSSGEYVQSEASQQQEVFRVTYWADGASCAFVLFLSFAILFLAIVQTIRLSLHLIRNTDSSFIEVFLTCISNVVIFVMLLGTAPAVTVGFRIWCESVTHNHARSCSISALVMKWEDHTLHTKSFFTEMAMVEFGLYFLFVIWAIESLFSLYKLLNYHRQEHFLRSLSRERQRLLGEYRQTEYMT